ncbi:DUF956 family protein [Lactococcus taiwanensis]|uniref:DUF956 family protein n=1 Tax=Lactococcus taiwanensis TaxID=1151742 RepID=A0AA45KFN5_9LACT|nr:DUF956 family protein [Lactococcus taiwanensis]QSE76404.1 DUF956 family protein [Lactococcus taiwanensis]
MAQSLNTKADFSTEGIAYLGFAEYGKILIGDVAFEFYNDRNVEKNMTFPWSSILRVEGDVTKTLKGQVKVGRQFSIVLQNGSKVRFSSKESGTVLRWMRDYLGNEKVVKSPSFLGTFKNAFKRKRKK